MVGLAFACATALGISDAAFREMPGPSPRAPGHVWLYSQKHDAPQRYRPSFESDQKPRKYNLPAINRCVRSRPAGAESEITTTQVSCIVSSQRNLPESLKCMVSAEPPAGIRQCGTVHRWHFA